MVFGGPLQRGPIVGRVSERKPDSHMSFSLNSEGVL